MGRVHSGQAVVYGRGRGERKNKVRDSRSEFKHDKQPNPIQAPLRVRPVRVVPVPPPASLVFAFPLASPVPLEPGSIVFSIACRIRMMSCTQFVFSPSSIARV